MAMVDPKSFRFSMATLAWLAAPVLVLGLGSNLLGRFGYPLDHLAEASVQNGHLEAAGRLRMLATWLLLTVTSAGCTLYFLWSVRRFARHVAGPVVIVYAGLAAIGVVSVAMGGVPGGQRIVDERVICAAFALMEPGAQPPAARTPPPTTPPAAGAPAPAATRPPGSGGDVPPTLKLYGPPRPTGYDRTVACPDNESSRLLRALNEFQKYLLVLLIPALVLGTLSCLALPAIPSPADCRFQVRRLNVHLYLTATVLVAGLLFLSALLHWPAFAFDKATAASYNVHVDAYILFWGITYTLFIASYYVPVAVLLTKRCEAPPPEHPPGKAPPVKAPPAARAQKDEAAGDPAGELTGLLKTLAALFAPAIAGLLGGIIHL